MLPEHGLVESFHEESVLSDLSFVPAARFLENGIPAVIVSFEEERVLLFGLGGVGGGEEGGVKWFESFEVFYHDLLG